MTKHKSKFLENIFVTFFGIVFSFISFKVFDVIYDEQKSAFIDEIFHIPQAELYCKNQWTKEKVLGNEQSSRNPEFGPDKVQFLHPDNHRIEFESLTTCCLFLRMWNPKITTLPGLYIVSYFLLKPLAKFGFENYCSTYALRFTNLIASTLNFFLAFKICCALEQKYKTRTKFLLKVLTALNIAIFPPLYFFTFLYYTDVWSTSFVLLMYYLHLLNGKSSKILGVFVSLMAVMMRQTNIIWVVLMIIDDAWNILTKNFKSVSVQDYKYSKEVIQRFILEFFNFKKTFKLIHSVLSKTLNNLIVVVLFIIFIAINKSIVLGDKEAHSATFHPMQNLYFLDFLAFFGWPFLLTEVVSLKEKPPNVFLIIFLVGLCAGLSEANKLQHPYLLADNRHLAFYLWKRVFGHPVFRRIIIPTYVASGILLVRHLQKRCHFMFSVALSLGTFLNLTPQYLFELRYFIVPFLMFRLQFRQSLAVVVETAFFIAINAAVIYLFLNRPFTWPSEPGVKQRFIW